MGSFISFIPTEFEEIDNFFQLAPVSATDVVYDLGCGDGRLLFAALERGAGRAVGVDLDPARVREARDAAARKGWDDRASFIEGDVLEVDLSEATLVLCYLITEASKALKPRFESELRAGTRIVMESFPVPGWKPLDTRIDWYKTFYLYRMPPEAADQNDPEPPFISH